MTLFEEIIMWLHPDVVLMTCELPSDNARANFPLMRVTVDSGMEFRNVILNYVKHNFCYIYGQPCDDFLAGKLAQDALGDIDRLAFWGTSGANGGVATILNKICEFFKEFMRNQYYDMVISQLVDSLNDDEKIALMALLKEHLSRFAPSYFEYSSPEIMAADYKKNIIYYMQKLGEFRNLYRYY